MQSSKTDIRQRAYQYALRIVRFMEDIPKDMAGRTIGNQLMRSGTSIGANIVEAQASSSKKDFTKFIIISLKSANESLFWLRLLKDSGKVGLVIDPLITETHEIANILGASVLTLKGKR
jgi:four helix bundle protein